MDTPDLHHLQVPKSERPAIPTIDQREHCGDVAYLIIDKHIREHITFTFRHDQIEILVLGTARRRDMPIPARIVRIDIAIEREHLEHREDRSGETRSERIVVEYLTRSRFCKELQILNGLVRGNLTRALEGEDVGTIIFQD